MGFYDEMQRYALSDSQLEQCVKDGIISSRFDSLLSEQEGNYYVPRCPSKDDLVRCGVKLAFTVDDGDLKSSLFPRVSFFVTEFHMIVFRSPGYEHYRVGKYSRQRSSKPAIHFAVPLESFRNVELEVGEERMGFTDAQTVTVEKGDPVLGSAIGAGLFGAAGAIGGALANSGTETRVVVPSLFHLYQNFGLRFNMVEDGRGDPAISLSPLFKLDNADGTKDYSFNKSMNAQLLGKPANKEVPRYCCDELNRLIAKAKSTVEDKDRAAVTKPQLDQAESDAKFTNVVQTVLGLVLVGLIALFWINF